MGGADVGTRSQTDDGYCRVAGRTGALRPPSPACGRGHQTGFPGSGPLPPKARGPRQQGVYDLQAPHDGPGRRERRSQMGRTGRRPGDPGGPVVAVDADRRAAAVLERADRRDEPGRAAAGEKMLREGVCEGRSAVRVADDGKAGDNGMGAGKRGI